MIPGPSRAAHRTPARTPIPRLAIAATPAAAQQIENELVLITPVAKTLPDPLLADFVAYAKERWNVSVKASALAAGTPVAYGQSVEWKGRPQADIFWGGNKSNKTQFSDEASQIFGYFDNASQLVFRLTRQF